MLVDNSRHFSCKEHKDHDRAYHGKERAHIAPLLIFITVNFHQELLPKLIDRLHLVCNTAFYLKFGLPISSHRIMNGSDLLLPITN